MRPPAPPALPGFRPQAPQGSVYYKGPVKEARYADHSLSSSRVDPTAPSWAAPAASQLAPNGAEGGCAATHGKGVPLPPHTVLRDEARLMRNSSTGSGSTLLAQPQQAAHLDHNTSGIKFVEDAGVGGREDKEQEELEVRRAEGKGLR